MRTIPCKTELTDYVMKAMLTRDRSPKRYVFKFTIGEWDLRAKWCTPGGRRRVVSLRSGEVNYVASSRRPDNWERRWKGHRPFVIESPTHLPTIPQFIAAMMKGEK